SSRPPPSRQRPAIIDSGGIVSTAQRMARNVEPQTRYTAANAATTGSERAPGPVSMPGLSAAAGQLADRAQVARAAAGDPGADNMAAVRPGRDADRLPVEHQLPAAGLEDDAELVAGRQLHLRRELEAGPGHVVHPDRVLVAAHDVAAVTGRQHAGRMNRGPGSDPAAAVQNDLQQPKRDQGLLVRVQLGLLQVELGTPRPPVL